MSSLLLVEIYGLVMSLVDVGSPITFPANFFFLMVSTGRVKRALTTI